MDPYDGYGSPPSAAKMDSRWARDEDPYASRGIDSYRRRSPGE